jgi:hypothetical protein
MKKNPHLGQSMSGEFGRNASRKKAMIAGTMQIIMMMKRRLGFLSIRNPRAKRSISSIPFAGATKKLTDEQNETESVAWNSSLEKSVEWCKSKRLRKVMRLVLDQIECKEQTLTVYTRLPNV